MNRRSFFQTMPASLAGTGLAVAQAGRRIQRIDIIHHTHTDVGYTDLPSVCREMQKRFIDIALDTCLRDRRFRWTIESMLGLDDWWRAATETRRRLLVGRIEAGQMDAMALAFNQAPFLNAMQWDRMLAWIPAPVWQAVRPRAAMQNDVNGFPRAGAMRLLDRGIRHLLMGINADSGGPPFRRPSAFWWKMPDGRRLFVWLGDHYGTAYRFFEPENWIRQQPRWAQTEYRPPHPGEIHRTDETSLRAAEKHLATRLAALEESGYDYPTLILSYTNQWRYDNDPPLPHLSEFIDAWNKLGLKPTLRFTLATSAVMDMEREVGDRVPELSGEWTDWWANGIASGPREVAASRAAKRYLRAAVAPGFGPIPDDAQKQIHKMLGDLCLFDEHTWGANVSISQPHSLFTSGQYTEKSLLAYRPMGHAEALLGRRARARTDSLPHGLHVVNTSSFPFSGWAAFSFAGLRSGAKSLVDPKSGRRYAIQLLDRNLARFWIEELSSGAVLSLQPSAEASEDRAGNTAPEIALDASGWPVSATWPGMDKPLFQGECAQFIAAQIVPPGNRSAIAKLHSTADAAARGRMREEWLRMLPASHGAVKRWDTAHTVSFIQSIQHARLANAERRLELWKSQPRARITVRFDRITSMDPEVLYLAFAVPIKGVMPSLSNGGAPFTPYADQLPGSVRDYFAIDGCAHYRTPAGDWLWVTRDAPLVTVGGPHTLARRTDPPPDTHRILSMVFDNCWHTNFVADSHGTMAFQFDLVWRKSIEAPVELAEALVAEPVIVVRPEAVPSPEVDKYLYRT